MVGHAALELKVACGGIKVCGGSGLGGGGSRLAQAAGNGRTGSEVVARRRGGKEGKSAGGTRPEPQGRGAARRLCCTAQLARWRTCSRCPRRPAAPPRPPLRGQQTSQCGQAGSQAAGCWRSSALLAHPAWSWRCRRWPCRPARSGCCRCSARCSETWFQEISRGETRQVSVSATCRRQAAGLYLPHPPSGPAPCNYAAARCNPLPLPPSPHQGKGKTPTRPSDGTKSASQFKSQNP